MAVYGRECRNLAETLAGLAVLEAVELRRSLLLDPRVCLGSDALEPPDENCHKLQAECMN